MALFALGSCDIEKIVCLAKRECLPFLKGKEEPGEVSCGKQASEQFVFLNLQQREDFHRQEEILS
jgi:hypothetical protein